MIIIMSVATQVDRSDALIRLFHPDNSHLFAAGKTSTNPSLFFFPQLARLQRIANRSYLLAEKIITKLPCSKLFDRSSLHYTVQELELVYGSNYFVGSSLSLMPQCQNSHSKLLLQHHCN